jgi:hypothetical protein
MKCPECGSEVAPGEKFCGNCGATIESEDLQSGAEEEATPDADQEEAPDTEVEAPSSGETVVIDRRAEPLPEPDEPPAAEELEFDDAPPPPPPPTAPVAQSGSQRKTWISVAIVVAVILLCCCCVVVAAIAFSEDILYAIEDLGIARAAPTVLRACGLA